MGKHPIVDSVFIGGPKKITDDRGTWTSSIFRERVDGPVQLSKDGLAGDKVTQRYHGRPDAALCVHLLDHYLFWRHNYGLNLQPGVVGENVTLDGITEDEICIGDIVSIGTATVQVSGPRVPCANQARRVGRTDWVKLTIKENRTGFYMRVVEPGFIQAGDAWVLLERPNEDGAIPSINRCMYLDFDPAYAQRIVEMIGIAQWWRQQAMEKLAEEDEHWTATMKA